MEDLKSAIEDHLDQMGDLLQKVSAELRSGLRPAYDNFLGFFHAIDWKEPWLIGLLGFHFLLLLTAISSRKNINFQMFLFLLASRIMKPSGSFVRGGLVLLRFVVKVSSFVNEIPSRLGLPQPISLSTLSLLALQLVLHAG
ncbi:hypothetical protein TIFTF001_027360 [Ficus carica]|uniref:Transmembrane protein 18 n=1 Tax=Ficus carica TaxID=3494 RepID=A0AA88J056_FICCA|nr:hypothetical protein TIFTF001_027360 [Ficus carica]